MGKVWLSVEFRIFIGKDNFWQTIRRLRGKSSITSMQKSTGNNLRGEKEILSRWRESFEDLVNPAKPTSTDTCNSIDFDKEEVFTLTEVTAVLRGLKSGKAAGEGKNSS